MKTTAVSQSKVASVTLENYPVSILAVEGIFAARTNVHSLISSLPLVCFLFQQTETREARSEPTNHKPPRREPRPQPNDRSPNCGLQHASHSRLSRGHGGRTTGHRKTAHWPRKPSTSERFLNLFRKI